MRSVLYVLTDKNIGGAGRWLLQMLRHIDRERYRVSVLLPEDSLLCGRVRELDVPVLRVAGMCDRSWDAGAFFGMLALFRQEKPDIVHVGASLTARLAARCAGVPLLLMTKHCAAQDGGTARRLLHRYGDSLLTDRILAVSQRIGQELADCGTPPERIAVVPNGIAPIIPYEGAERERFCRQLGLDPAFRWVGIAARLERIKGVDRFLEAARLLAPKFPQVRFAVFGTGSEEDALRCAAADLRERVFFFGFCTEIEQALSLLTVNVVSSRSEAFSLSALEGMSVGVPAAAFAVDGVPEVVRDGETGLLVPEGDVPALAAAIERLLSDEPLRLRLAENGKRLARDTYTAENMVRKTETLYEEILSQKRGCQL